jgi:hypothetical protein
MKSRFVIAVASCPILAACSGSLGTDPDPSRTPKASAAESHEVRNTPLPTEAPPRPAPQTLGVAVEGRCGELDVSFVGDKTFVHHGHLSGTFEPASTFVLGRVTDTGIEDDPSLIRGIRRSDAENWRGFHLLSMEGSWPNDSTLSMWSEGGERVGSVVMEYAWKGDKWQLKPERPPRDDEYGVSQKWANGSTLWLHPYGTYPEFAVVPRGKAKMPDFGSLRVRDTPEECLFDYGAMLATESGDVYLAGRYCGIFPTHEAPTLEKRGEAALARWTPGGRAKLEPIPSVAKHAALRLTGLREAAGKIYAFGTIVKADETAEESYIARSDPAGWTRVTAPFKSARRYEIESDGTMWAWAEGTIYRRGASAEDWEKASLEGVKDIAWKEQRPAWAMTAKELFRRGDDGTWAKIDVPKPSFSAEGAFQLDTIKLSPSGELWASASYAEKRQEWTQPEERHALLRFGAQQGASRCDAGGSGDHTFFQGWPATASEACATPFALLVRVSKSAPATYDYPQTRAALKGHKELEGAEFVDIELEGRRYFGAKPKSLAQGRAAVEVVGKKVQGTRPELVCLAPKVTRTLPIDLTTGAVARSAM